MHVKLPLAKLRHHHHFKPGASHTGAQSGHEQVPLMLYWQPGKRSFVEALRRKECSHKPLLQRLLKLSFFADTVQILAILQAKDFPRKTRQDVKGPPTVPLSCQKAPPHARVRWKQLLRTLSRLWVPFPWGSPGLRYRAQNQTTLCSFQLPTLFSLHYRKQPQRSDAQDLSTWSADWSNHSMFRAFKCQCISKV